jgi:hypothetical protein
MPNFLFGDQPIRILGLTAAGGRASLAGLERHDRIAAADAASSYSLFPEEGRPVDDHVDAGGGLLLPGHDR